VSGERNKLPKLLCFSGVGVLERFHVFELLFVLNLGENDLNTKNELEKKKNRKRRRRKSTESP